MSLSTERPFSNVAHRAGSVLRRNGVLLLLITVAGVVLRIWNIRFGLPNTTCRPDEQLLIIRALEMGDGDMNPHYFFYPHLWFYVLFFLYEVYYLFGLLYSIFPSAQEFYYSYFADPSPFYVIARYAGAAVGTATIPVVYLLGKRGYSNATGLLSALFLSFCFLHARDSHFGTVDIPMTFCTSLAFFLIFRLYSSGSRKDCLLAGGAVGLATAIKYNAVLLLVPLCLAYVLRAPESQQRRRILLSTDWLLMAGSCGLVFVICSPFVLLDYTGLRQYMQGLAIFYEKGHGQDFGPGPVYHLTFSLRYGMGIALETAALAGMVLGCFRWRNRHNLLILSFVIIYYFSVGSSKAVFMRYMLPLLPLLCVMAAELVVTACLRLASSDRVRIGIGVAVASMLLLDPIHRIVQFDRFVGLEDTRLPATRWVESYVPSGAAILLVGFSYPEFHVMKDVLALRLRVGDYGFLSSRYLFLAEVVERTKSFHHPQYIVKDITSMDYVDDAMLQMFDYLILMDYRYLPWYSGLSDEKDRKPVPGTLLKEFSPYAHGQDLPEPVFDREDAFYTPLARFQALERPGPHISIYWLDSSPVSSSVDPDQMRGQP